MTALVAVLWVLYLSECFVRWRPGDWVFRETLAGEVRAAAAPDITLFNERVALAWTTVFPWAVAHVCAGEDLDRDRLRQRLDVLEQEGRRLRTGAAALFAVLLLVVPLLILTGRLLPLLPWVGGALVVAWAFTFASFVRAYPRVHGSRPPIETWLVLALSPVDLVRAPAVLSLHAVADAHPVALAGALSGDAEFLRVARLWHFDAPGLRPAIEAVARARDLEESLLAAPSHVEPGVSLFCRRCHATFTGGASRCADCEGVELTRLA